MRRALQLIILIFLTCVASTVVAQDDELVGKPPTGDRIIDLDAEEPPPPEEMSEPEEPTDEERALEDGERMFQAAAFEIREGTAEQAVLLLGQLLERYPDHPRAPQARRLLVEWEERLADEEAAKRRRRGRTLLGLGQGLHGFGVGVELWHLALEEPFVDSTPGVMFGLGLAGAAIGIGTSVALTSDGIEPGHAGLLNSGPVWGFFLGYTASRTNYGIRNRGRLVSAMLGQFAGMGAGHLVWRIFEPTAGQVWVADSAAFWGAVLSTTFIVAADASDFPPRRPILAGTHFWGATMGLVGGGVVAAAAPDITVMRVMLMNVGGALGGLAGALVGALVLPDLYGSSAAWGFTLGAPLGLLTAGLLTSNVDRNRAKRREALVGFGVSPLQDGGHAITVGGRF